MLKYEDLKNKPRELLAATGLKAEEFDGLLAAFSQVYATRYRGDKTVEGQPRQRQQGVGIKAPCLETRINCYSSWFTRKPTHCKPSRGYSLG